jgi:glycosyltransferase involved in cell wall biosynthesis
MTKSKVLHQFLVDVSSGDATSDHAFLIRGWLRELGFESEIFSPVFDEELASEVRQFTPNSFSSRDPVIYHHTIGSDILNDLLKRRVPMILIYHNITPPEFFSSSDPVLANLLVKGREQLREIQPLVRLALGASDYSEQELKEFGFESTGVLPIVLNESAYDSPVDKQLQAKIQEGAPTLLFVGRVAPNKRQEDLVKLLFFVRQILPRARLMLVGSLKASEYVDWLQRFIDRHGLADAVTLAGHVTHQEMVTCYRSADIFVSMSEHEGFGKPLIESMYCGLPVLAYSAAAIPYTTGDAGVLFTRKEFEPLSEMVRMLYEDQDLRQRIIDTQMRRVQAFLEPTVKQQFAGYLAQLKLL